MGKNKTLFFGLIVLLCSSLLLGCSFPIKGKHASDADHDDEIYYVYYLNADENQLVKEELNLESDNQEDLLGRMQKAVSSQSEENKSKKKKSLLPDNLDIGKIESKDGVMTIYLGKNYHEMSRQREMLVRMGLVKMFTQIPGVERVEFVIGTAPLKDPSGEVVGAMTNDSFVENAGKDIHTYQSQIVMLYFANDDGTRLLEEPRKIYFDSNETLEKAIVAEIINGPHESKHHSTISPDTSIISVVVQDDICYVNLTRGSAAVVTNAAENVKIYSVVNSLVTNCKVKKVQFSIDGDTSGTFAGAMPLNQLYKIDKDLIIE